MYTYISIYKHMYTCICIHKHCLQSFLAEIKCLIKKAYILYVLKRESPANALEGGNSRIKKRFIKAL